MPAATVIQPALAASAACGSKATKGSTTIDGPTTLTVAIESRSADLERASSSRPISLADCQRLLPRWRFGLPLHDRADQVRLTRSLERPLSSRRYRNIPKRISLSGCFGIFRYRNDEQTRENSLARKRATAFRRRHQKEADEVQAEIAPSR